MTVKSADTALANFRAELFGYAARRTDGPSPNLRKFLQDEAKQSFPHLLSDDMDRLMAEIDRAAGY